MSLKPLIDVLSDFENAIGEIVERKVRKELVIIHAYIGFQFEKTQKQTDKNKTFNKGKKLRRQSGALFRSLSPFSKDSNTKVTRSKNRVDASVGSKLPYASVHETGNPKFIKAKKKATREFKSGKKITVFAMENFFWKKYIESKNEMFKIIALAVKKNGGIKVKKRPYVAPALKQWEKERRNNFVQEILDSVIIFLNTGQIKV